MQAAPRFKRRVKLGLTLLFLAGCVIGWVGPSHSRPLPASTPPTVEDTLRFLEHSTWGAWGLDGGFFWRAHNAGFEQFLEEQFNAPMSSYPTLPLYPQTRPEDCTGTCQRDNYTMYLLQNRFFTNALYGEDQLRQRVAFALHQILVVSAAEIRLPSWMAPYLQILDRNAFGNYRQLLYEITLNPAMGNYLDMAGNTRTNPNENYAREILQLFSIGLYRLNPDGTPQLDEFGRQIPTFDQDIINAFSRVFTGWNRAAAPAPGVPNYINPMVPNQNQHDVGPKTLLRGVTLPPNQSAAKDLNDALDNIFMDPNVGPFIGKQLIQHLVTSNPSPDYVRRVTAAFDDNGQGVRGDLKAVVRAILLDPEALADRPTPPTPSSEGHLKHPVVFMLNLLRTFYPRSADGSGLSDGYLNPQATAMGMNVFSPPSVFSYFSPFTGVPGTNLRGPEFGVLNTSTALARANFVNTMVNSRIPVSANAPSGTSLDFSGFLWFAQSPELLADGLNTWMMAGRMSPAMRADVIAAVAAVPAGPDLEVRRIRAAAYLIATSAQYQVER